ncbi:hypothetical protein GCM10010156_46810 [Planobispora rosea]|uniref:OmpR/PhoB-type domain-containing protein n=1 Tax=Planobispora rosea TaxID=35762 RepID=A0A8J3S379_PLARO|nr:BTAD domain-containing putative transcriptional regulator [Planobispora rosea]GGS82776.1 hypothetical protein GCM10010156_46810 [Planobispora rosea]GIH84204.1 hypothetical protein Pro02_26120 [Planobispora rosea]
MGVRFTVLGPVEVTVDGVRLDGLAPRHRAVLAYLLLHAGTVLGRDRLIDAMWGPTPPETARSQIHAAVTAIRRVLRRAGAADMLQTREAGYVIVPRAGQLDLDEFTGALSTAGDPQRIRAALALWRGAALALWRGEPFADVTADYAADARALLTERRLSAFERLAELELALGRPEGLIDDLAAQVVAHPLREKLTCQLMRALHLAGRQPDALAAARAFRARLADEQGLDPSRAFAALEQEILTGDAARPPVEQTSFLPRDLPDFAGRDDELGRLTRETRDGMIYAIDGMAGIGKTTLAVHTAHRLAGRYPDGRLFVDLLRDHARALAAPEETSDALGRLCDHYLGVAITAMDRLFPYSRHLRPSAPSAASATSPGTRETSTRPTPPTIGPCPSTRRRANGGARPSSSATWVRHTSGRATTSGRQITSPGP